MSRARPILLTDFAKPIRTVNPLFRLKLTDFQSSIEAYTEFSPPEPTPVISGPSIEPGSASNIGCTFALWDPDDNLWDFNYEAWLKDGSGTSIASSSNNVYAKPAINGSVYGQGSEGTYSCDVDWYVNGVFLGSGHTTFAVCADVRDNMIEEYRAGQVAWTPNCSDFANSGGTTHFGWSELNGQWQTDGNPHNPWGHVRAALTTGLEDTRTEYNRGGIRLSSGYRCPQGNSLAGGAQQSFHVYGRAADMFSNDHAWTEDEFNLLREAADGTGTVELLQWNSYSDHHLHAAW